MGELHANMHVTLDGVITANGGPTAQDGWFRYAGWEGPYGDAASGEVLMADGERADALLLGRVTYDIFRGYWPGKTDRIGTAFDAVPKYVVSRGDAELSWEGTTLLPDAAAVADARARHREIQTWGSGALLQTLLREGLVDQLNLWVAPVVLGEGAHLFPAGTPAETFALAEPPRAFPGGSLLLRYRALRTPPPTVPEDAPIPR